MAAALRSSLPFSGDEPKRLVTMVAESSFLHTYPSHPAPNSSPPYQSPTPFVSSPPYQSPTPFVSYPPYQPPRHFQDPEVYHPSYNQLRPPEMYSQNQDPNQVQSWNQHLRQNQPWIQPFQQDWVNNSSTPPSFNLAHHNHVNHSLSVSFQPNLAHLNNYQSLQNQETNLQYNQFNWNAHRPDLDHTAMSSPYPYQNSNPQHQSPYTDQLSQENSQQNNQLGNQQLWQDQNLQVHPQSQQIPPVQPNLPNAHQTNPTPATLEIPRFDGNYVDDWVIKAESYFKGRGISARCIPRIKMQLKIINGFKIQVTINYGISSLVKINLHLILQALPKYHHLIP